MKVTYFNKKIFKRQCNKKFIIKNYFLNIIL